VCGEDAVFFVYRRDCVGNQGGMVVVYRDES
jgi:hypothetical protein